MAKGYFWRFPSFEDGINERTENGENMRGVEFLQAEVGRLTAAIAHHQNGDLIGAGSSGSSDAAA